MKQRNLVLMMLIFSLFMFTSCDKNNNDDNGSGNDIIEKDDDKKPEESQEYIVEFLLDYTGAPNLDPQKVTKGNTVNEPNSPLRIGYEFLGWYIEEIKYDFNQAVERDLFLTAHWKVNEYTITYKVDGKVVGEVETYNFGSSIALREDLKKTGYTFSGWNYEEFPLTMPDKNLVVTAEFTLNKYLLTWIVDDLETEIEYEFDAEVSTLTDPQKTGYTFIGWDIDVPNKMPANNVTITAQFKVNEYTLTWMVAGTITSNKYYFNEEIDYLKNPEKIGHSFIGWDIEVPNNMPANDLTITAQFKINKYTITFDCAGGSEVDSITQDYDTLIDLPAEPTKEGYTFAGWNIEVPKTMPARNLTLTALWKEDDALFIISFDLAYLEALNPEPKIITEGNKLNEPEEPIREGFIFLGWYLNEKLYDFNNIVLKDFVLKAKWEKIIVEYVVSFDLNYEGAINPESAILIEGSKIGEPDSPLRIGYEFLGWYEENSNEKWSFINDVVYENIILKAFWKKNLYIISFDLDEGMPLLENQKIEHGEKILKPPNPEKTGFSFVSWLNVSSNKEWDFLNDVVTKNLTLKAIWNKNVYTVLFDTDEGVQLPKTQEVEHGERVLKPADPIRSGYSFIGWFDEETNEEWNFSNDVVIQDLILRALWEINVYIISFNADGGSPTPNTQEIEHGEKALKPLDPEKIKHIFLGWYKENSEVLYDFNSEVKENLNLVAKWEVVKTPREQYIEDILNAYNYHLNSNYIKVIGTGELKASIITQQLKLVKEKDNNNFYYFNGVYGKAGITISNYIEGSGTLNDFTHEKGTTTADLEKDKISSTENITYNKFVDIYGVAVNELNYILNDETILVIEKVGNLYTLTLDLNKSVGKYVKHINAVNPYETKEDETKFSQIKLEIILDENKRFKQIKYYEKYSVEVKLRILGWMKQDVSAVITEKYYYTK